MKKTLNIFMAGVILLAVQACGSKAEKSSEESATETPTETPIIAPLTTAERYAKIEEDRNERIRRWRLQYDERGITTPTYTDADGNVVYNKAEVDPSFTGGDKAMVQYLKDNLKYPKEAEDAGVEGTVFVDFVVTKNGQVREAMVMNTPGEDVDSSLRMEAIRVVSSMPAWVAGRQHGKAVDVNYSIPITFQMD